MPVKDLSAMTSALKNDQMLLYFVVFVQYVLEMEAKMDQLRGLVEAADREKVELINQLEEEKRCSVTKPFASKDLNRRPCAQKVKNCCFYRRVEDLQFRVEEACITKGDLEVFKSNDSGFIDV